MKNIRSACLQNLYHYWENFAANADSNMIKNNGLLACFSGLGAGVFNPVFQLPKDFSYADAKKNLAANITNHPLPISWWQELHDESSPPNEILLAHAQQYFGRVPVMYYEINARYRDVSLPAGIIIKEITGSELDQWIIPITSSFDFSTDNTKDYVNVLKRADALIHFSAELNGTTIGTGSIYCDKELAGFYNLSVLPAYRHQAIARAIHIARLNKAYELGYRAVTLQSMPLALKMNLQMGFKEVTSLDIFVDQL